MSYSFSSRVRYSEVGENGQLTLPSLLNYFQDCGTFETEDIGFGTMVLKARNKAWVLAAWQVVIERLPMLGEEVIITTLPYEFHGVMGMRNYYMETKDHERLAYANSFWTFFDTEKQMPSRVSQDLIDSYTLDEKLDMEYTPRKIRAPKEWEERPTFVVQKQHLDTNHHVNNVQYITMAADFLPDSFHMHQMRAEYKAQARLGDEIHPWINQDGDKVTIMLANEEQKPYAVVEFTKA
ncbi:MAG: thioesterase [Eubacteriales bacterium]|nr:thioesterase [Eubacteriales bacterium]